MTTLDSLIDYKQLVEALSDTVIVADPACLTVHRWRPICRAGKKQRFKQPL